jgi:rhamnosyltransferase
LKTAKIAVLLPAYNGTQWLPEQVASILRQIDVEVTIFFSVDSSSDGTEAWVDTLAATDSRVKVLPHGEHFGGAARNVYRLIRDTDFSSFDYIALADQDDIWLHDKLVTAHHIILNKGLSGYSGSVTAFWADGRKRLLDKAQQQRKYDYLFEAGGPGCTYVLTVSDAMRFKDFLLLNIASVNEVSMHDWLIYAWFRSQELKWYIDPEPKMLYRQHGGNQVGANVGVRAIKARLTLLLSGWYRTEVFKIAHLLQDKLDVAVRPLAVAPGVPMLLLLTDFNQLRRRFRDRCFLIVIIFFGIY